MPTSRLLERDRIGITVIGALARHAVEVLHCLEPGDIVEDGSVRDSLLSSIERMMKSVRALSGDASVQLGGLPTRILMSAGLAAYELRSGSGPGFLHEVVSDEFPLLIEALHEMLEENVDRIL